MSASFDIGAARRLIDRVMDQRCTAEIRALIKMLIDACDALEGERDDGC